MTITALMRLTQLMRVQHILITLFTAAEYLNFTYISYYVY